MPCPLYLNGAPTAIPVRPVVPLRQTAAALGFAVTQTPEGLRLDNGLVHTTVTPGLDRYCTATSLPRMVGMSAPFSLGFVPVEQNGDLLVSLELFRILLGSRSDALRLENGAFSLDVPPKK